MQRAAGVIVAADKKVEMDRFNGKHLVNRPVSDGIRKTEQLINEALSGDAPVFHSSGQTVAEESSADGTFGQRIYKDF